MSDTTKPNPMSEADRRALMHALADGKICKLMVEGDAFIVRQSPTHPRIEYRQGELWCSLGLKVDRWLSWSEVREPRVFEFEYNTDASVYPESLRAALISGASFKVRFEEILP